MQDCTYATEADRDAAQKFFRDACINTEKVEDKTLRSFHRGDTEQALQDKLRGAYDAAMSSGLADMVQQLRIRRNDPCPCGSNVKFKKCCMWKCQ